MAIERLNVKIIDAAKPGISGATGKPIPRMLNDGKGLLLRVAPGGTKSWIYRYRASAAKVVDIGLGRYDPDGKAGDGYTLAEARARAAEQRRLRRDGIDPLAQRLATAPALPADEPESAITFRQVAEKFVAAKEAGWSSQHRKDVLSKFALHVYPVIGDMPVAGVDTKAVMRVIEPKWLTNTETMARTRSQIEMVLGYAVTSGYRAAGDNPARWDKHLENLLPKKAAVAKVEKQPAMRWQDLPAYMGSLRTNASVVARALEFTILTAARTDEVLGATWQEIDLKARTWTLPASRMKAGRDHRVALSDAALAILAALPKGRKDELVFPGRHGKLNNNSMTRIVEKTALRSEDGRRPTVHGFRGSFRTWALEHDYRQDVIEMALAHKSGDDVAERYTHTDLLAHRQQLAEAWGRHCGG